MGIPNYPKDQASEWRKVNQSIRNLRQSIPTPSIPAVFVQSSKLNSTSSWEANSSTSYVDLYTAYVVRQNDDLTIHFITYAENAACSFQVKDLDTGTSLWSTSISAGTQTEQTVTVSFNADFGNVQKFSIQGKVDSGTGNARVFVLNAYGVNN